jgi:hypothetical protein
VIRVDRRRDNERIDIDTPNATVSLLHAGEYYIEASESGDQTIVRTRTGQGEVSVGQQSWTVRDNEEGVFTGTATLAASINSSGPRTAFEDWANDRHRRNAGVVSSRYVSNEVVGYQDLDRYGEWVSEPSYGHVWRPSYVVSGWAPYRYGRWVWVSPWGWNWIDDSPWGYAPFHYGRWAYVRSRWCWVPGPRYVRPVYAPALVAWTGGSGFSASVAFGSGIGWFPLGPREVYVPGYRYSRGYLHNVNVSNTFINNTYISNIYYGRGRNFDYRYGRDPHAVTVVDRDRFAGGQLISRTWSRADVRDLRRWHHDPRPPAVVPNRNSVFAARVLGRIPNGADRIARDAAHDGARRGRSSTTGAGTHFARVPFEAERRAIEANGGRPVSRSQLVAARPALRAETVSARSDEAQPAQRGAGDGPRVRDDAWREQGRREQAQRADMSSPSSRSLSDRPGWAQRQRSDSLYSPEMEAARVRALEQLHRDREQRSTQPSDGATASERPTTNTPVNSLRVQPRQGDSGSVGFSDRAAREAPQQWRGDNAPQGVQGNVERPRQNHTQDQRNSVPREAGGFSQRDNAASQPRSWQQSQPQYRAPREQPRIEQPRAEQSRREVPGYEQPRPNPSQAQSQAPRSDRSDRSGFSRPADHQNFRR